MDNKKNKFDNLTNLIKVYGENKDSFNIEKLQDIRDNISIALFEVADDASKVISGYTEAQNIKNIKIAERKQFHISEKKTIIEANKTATNDCKKEIKNCTKSLKQKKQVELILSATKNILYNISSRIHIIT